METTGLSGAASAIAAGADGVLEAWIERYRGSTLRLPGEVDPRGLRPMFAPVIGALEVALSADDPRPGCPELRELEKDLSFLGANLAALGASGFDAAAVVLALRDALADRAADERERRRLHELFDWLSAVALEGYSHGRAAAVTERTREHLEERTPVVLVAPDIPAAFPIGDAGVNGLRGAFARLALQVARVGARAVIVDASGLVDPAAPTILEAVREFCGHRKIAGSVALVAAGLTNSQRLEWQYAARACGAAFDCRDTFWEALQVAQERSDFAFVRKESS